MIDHVIDHNLYYDVFVILSSDKKNTYAAKRLKGFDKWDTFLPFRSIAPGVFSGPSPCREQGVKNGFLSLRKCFCKHALGRRKTGPIIIEICLQDRFFRIWHCHHRIVCRCQKETRPER